MAMKHPGVETILLAQGNDCAQQLYGAEPNIWHVLDEFKAFAEDAYASHGIDWRTVPASHRAVNRLDRHLYRITSAPLIHGIMTKFAGLIMHMEDLEQPLVSVDIIKTIKLFEPAIEGHGTLHGSMRVFAYAASAWLAMAAEDFFIDLERDPSHWGNKVLRAHAAIDTAQVQDPLIPRLYEPFNDADNAMLSTCQRLTDMAMSSTVTALSVLAPAGRHASLWGANSETTVRKIVERNADKLGWVACLSHTVKEAYFPEPTLDAPPPRRCPFTHDAQKIAEGIIFDMPHLGAAPSSEQFCAADIPLCNPGDPPDATPTTAAEIQLRSSLPIAEETLWPRGYIPPLQCFSGGILVGT